MKIILSGGQIITIGLEGFDKFATTQMLSVVRTFGEQVCRLPQDTVPNKPESLLEWTWTKKGKKKAR